MSVHDDRVVLIYTTLPGIEAAQTCGRALVEARLAACVNIIPGMISLYAWEGSLDESEEAVMIVKTRAGMADAARAELARLHPYETPAIITLATEGVNGPYGDWLRAQTTPARGG